MGEESKIQWEDEAHCKQGAEQNVKKWEGAAGANKSISMAIHSGKLDDLRESETMVTSDVDDLASRLKWIDDTLPRLLVPRLGPRVKTGVVIEVTCPGGLLRG
jgi:hypothetical protein